MIHHYDKYRWSSNAVCASADCWQQFKPTGVVRKQMQCNDHSPAEIWFAQWEIQDGFLQEILVPKKSSSSAPDQLSSWAAVARWRGGEGCSVPATHQIGRSTVSNILGNSWDLPIHALRVIWNFVLQWGWRFAPPSWLRLDRRHCMLFTGHFWNNWLWWFVKPKTFTQFLLQIPTASWVFLSHIWFFIHQN